MIYILIFFMGIFVGMVIIGNYTVDKFCASKKIGMLKVAKLREDENLYLYLELDVHPSNIEDMDVVVLDVKKGPTV